MGSHGQDHSDVWLSAPSILLVPAALGRCRVHDALAGAATGLVAFSDPSFWHVLAVGTVNGEPIIPWWPISSAVVLNSFSHHPAPPLLGQNACAALLASATRYRTYLMQCDPLFREEASNHIRRAPAAHRRTPERTQCTSRSRGCKREHGQWGPTAPSSRGGLSL